MDLARAPRRAARKKGSGYENDVGTSSNMSTASQAQQIFGGHNNMAAIGFIYAQQMHSVPPQFLDQCFSRPKQLLRLVYTHTNQILYLI